MRSGSLAETSEAYPEPWVRQPERRQCGRRWISAWDD
jgi:hypothetical protein